jgi:hypothetical protein
MGAISNIARNNSTVYGWWYDRLTDHPLWSEEIAECALLLVISPKSNLIEA